MTEILLCTHNPLLTKSFYGMLRDEGYTIDVVEQPASIIRKALKKNYATIIIDSESFGLSAGEVSSIVKAILPEVILLIIGNQHRSDSEGALSVRAPLDLEEFIQVIHTISRFSKISQN